MGRVIGSICTLGILAVARGVHVFAEDEVEETLYPLTAVTADVDGVPPGMPHTRKVFFTTAPLDSLPPNSYVFLKELSKEFRWYGSIKWCLEEMSQDARRIEADAVFEVETHQHLNPGLGAPIHPTATGKAIALRDPCATKGISGEFRPADEADTSKNRAVSARCEEETTARPSGAKVTGGNGKCSVDQVLAMKAAGLADEQVKAACTK